MKVGQRHSTARLDGVGISDVRIYRACPFAGEVADLAGGQPGPGTPRQSRGAAFPDRDIDALLVVVAENPRSRLHGASSQAAGVEQEEAAIRTRGTVAHVMQERNEPAMAYVLYRGEYDKRRDPVKPDTPDVLPPCPRTCRATGLAWPVAASARASPDRPGHGQSVLAGSFRNRAGAHGRRLRRQRRASLASRTARLAGRRVPRVGLGRQAVLQAHGHLGHLSASRGQHAREDRKGPAKPARSHAGRGSGWTRR